MKKEIILGTALFLLLLNSVLAINLNVEKESSGEAMIAGLNEPAIFDLKITNLGTGDDFMFYSFFGSSMHPKGTVHINQGETKDVQIKIYPNEDFKERGFVNFEYFIRGSSGDELKEWLTVKIIELDTDIFEISSGEVDPTSSTLNVYIHNRVNFNFENLDVKFSSAFFNFEESFSLAPNEKKVFNVKLNKEDFKKLMAGFYTMNAEIEAGNQKAKAEGTIKFVEKDIVTTTKKTYGFIINTMLVQKMNEGNVIANSETVVRKNIISRLFTTFNTEPDYVERQGLAIYYTWTREVNPGETLEIKVKTNWLLPFVIFLLIITIVILAKRYSKTSLVLKKKINFVNAKGGEFALKVSILVHAKDYVQKVNITDRLPSLVKIYEKFGGDRPVRIDEKNRRIDWQFAKLEAGEKRILSYIVYSKIGILGKFALPSASAVFEKEGKIHESQSNVAFFVAEQRKKDLED